MTVKEAAARLHLAVPTIYQLIREGLLPARRLGPKRGKIVLDEADVERYWERSRVEQPTSPIRGQLKYF